MIFKSPQTPLSYAQLLEANNVMQTNGDETYWLCLTRTVQGSKLFPVSAYILFSYLNAFYRYPSLLRKIEERMTAEELGDLARNMGVKIGSLHMGWSLPAFYLLGRECLLSYGLIRPQDAAEDIVYVLDFWKRFQLARHRNDGHLTNREFGHRAQIAPHRLLEVFAADMFDCSSGDPLHEAAHGFMAATSQYCFLSACESRLNLHNTGPFKLDGTRQLLIRDFMDLGECSLPWLDGVAAEIPYNNLTVTMATEGCHFDIVDDWGSFESKPEFVPDMMTGIGLYTSDPLSGGYIPVGMGSAEELTATFVDLGNRIKGATSKLWMRMAGWSRDQLLDAGAFTYFAVIKDLAHIAGVFEVEDWFEIDPRAERFRSLLNDEYADSFLGELVGSITLPTQQRSPFTMMQHSDGPSGTITPLPYSILAGEDYVASVGGGLRGGTYLDPKVDTYQTTRGKMTLSEYNAAARETRPDICSPKYRYLCDTWVKYNAHTDLANELYKIDQRTSRTMKGRGTGVQLAGGQ